MSLGGELERNISEAWLRLRGKILSDPQELQRRLARRRSKWMRRPPRAWCIAIRASDRRITAAHWVISPEHAMDLDHPEHPYEPIEHEVIIGAHAIRRYCTPVCFSRADAEEVAEMLGVSRGFLWSARKRGQFGEDFYKGLGGKRGKPVPLLSPRGELLDPSARNFARPHPVWGSMWELLCREVPREFEQTVVRRPVFRRMDGVKIRVGRVALSNGDDGEVARKKPSPQPSPGIAGEEAETSNVQRSTSNVQSDSWEGEEGEGQQSPGIAGEEAETSNVQRSTSNVQSDSWEGEEGEAGRTSNTEHRTWNIEGADPHPSALAEYPQRRQDAQGLEERRKDANGDEMQHIGWRWV